MVRVCPDLAPVVLSSGICIWAGARIRPSGRRFNWLQCCFNWVLIGVICACRVPVTAVVSRVGCPGGSLPFTEFLHETDAIADGNQNHFHPGIAGDRVIEGTDGSDVLVVGEISDHVAALQRVVQQDQAPGRRRVSTSS